MNEEKYETHRSAHTDPPLRLLEGGQSHQRRRGPGDLEADPGKGALPGPWFPKEQTLPQPLFFAFIREDLN